MTQCKVRLVILILILFTAGCSREKDELTIPVRVHIEIGILPRSEPPVADYFYFNWGRIGVQSFQFEGKREVGENIYFETDPVKEIPLVEFNSDPVTICAFDIPQGVYNFMKWDIDLKSVGTSGLFGTDIPNTGLVIWATYEYMNGSDISLFLCISDTEKFSFRAYDPDGDSRVGISIDKINEVILLFDLNYAFSSISRESIERAEISTDFHGNPIIIISNNNNKYLYENLIYRILISSEAIVLTTGSAFIK